MSQQKKRFYDAFSGPLVGLLIGSVFLALLFFADSYMRMRRTHRTPTDAERLMSLAMAHPDKQIRKDLVDAVKKGEVVLRVDDLDERVDGTFSVLNKRPTITIDVTLIATPVSQAGQEIAFAVLTHEHQHYLQWLRMPAVRDLHEAYRLDVDLSPMQCVLKVATEDEAYALTCSAAHRYGWKAAIPNQCGSIGLSKRAERFVKKFSGLSECEDVWSTLVRTELPPLSPEASSPSSLPEESEQGGVQ